MELLITLNALRSASAKRITADVKGKDAIIFDDEIFTGGTMITSVETLEKTRVGKIYVGATHPVLSGRAVKNLEDLSVEVCCDQYGGGP